MENRHVAKQHASLQCHLYSFYKKCLRAPLELHRYYKIKMFAGCKPVP